MQADDGTRPRTPRSRLGSIAALAAAGAWLLGELPRLPGPTGDGLLGWFFGASEVAAQLRAPLALFLIALSVLIVPLRASKSQIAVVVAAAVLCAAPTVRRLIPRFVDATPDVPTLCVTHANLLHPNPSREALLDALAAEDPDVLVLCEVSAAWRRAALERFGESHPYTVDGKDQDEWNTAAWGQLVLSRFPLEAPGVREHWVGDVRQRPLVLSLIHI